MADELTYSLGISYRNGDLRGKVEQETFKVTQAAQEKHSPVVIVGNAAEEDLTLGDITANGYVYLRNLDPTNYITYGPKSAGVMVAFGRLKPKEAVIFRLDTGVILRWIANTAPVKVQVEAFGN